MCTGLRFSLCLFILSSFSALVTGMSIEKTVGEDVSSSSQPKTTLHRSTSMKTPQIATQSPPPSTATTQPPTFGPMSTINCGIAHPQTYNFWIPRGEESKPYGWPWLVNVQSKIGRQPKWGHSCGGSLIRVADNVNMTDVVITARHCMEYDPPWTYRIVAGDFNITKTEGHEVTRYLKDVHLAPQENGLGHRTERDIAVLILSKAVEFNTEIQPVCLPEDANNGPVMGEQNCTVTGWGSTNDSISHKNYPSTPQEAVIEVTDKPASICAADKPEICAGFQGKGACFGDSGGPLNCELTPGKWTLSGVVSRGASNNREDPCASSENPGVYAKVTYNLDWIKSIVCQHSKFAPLAEGCQ